MVSFGYLMSKTNAVRIVLGLLAVMSHRERRTACAQHGTRVTDQNCAE
jgi:hypothetical protein